MFYTVLSLENYKMLQVGHSSLRTGCQISQSGFCLSEPDDTVFLQSYRWESGTVSAKSQRTGSHKQQHPGPGEYMFGSSLSPLYISSLMWFLIQCVYRETWILWLQWRHSVSSGEIFWVTDPRTVLPCAEFYPKVVSKTCSQPFEESCDQQETLQAVCHQQNPPGPGSGFPEGKAKGRFNTAAPLITNQKMFLKLSVVGYFHCGTKYWGRAKWSELFLLQSHRHLHFSLFLSPLSVLIVYHYWKCWYLDNTTFISPKKKKKSCETKLIKVSPVELQSLISRWDDVTETHEQSHIIRFWCLLSFVCVWVCLLLPGHRLPSPPLCISFTLTVWYHHRNVRRRRKCSKANEVFNSQRILPSERKRKTNVQVRQQLLSLWIRLLKEQWHKYWSHVIFCSSRWHHQSNLNTDAVKTHLQVLTRPVVVPEFLNCSQMWYSRHV